jgi:pimeloyl-ACP methyl ester carboxylesterase
MQTQVLQDESGSFEVSVRKNRKASVLVLFAVGAGGNPERHVTLLEALVKSGCTVVAPHFQRLYSPRPTEADLTLRARRLQLTLNTFIQPGTLSVVGVGHSIGAAILIALSGGEMWLGPGRRVPIAADARLTRLGLLAPPSDFFQAPHALDAVPIPIQLWVGSGDDITPPTQSQWLVQAMPNRQMVDMHIVEGAGHFSFMDQTPPHIVEPLQDKRAFLQEYSSELCKFVLGQ